jgi:uncharacterized membrane protein YfcA
MWSALPWGEIAWLAVAVLIAGVITGLLAGLFGIGGGAVIVPVLFEAFRLFGVSETVRMQLCVGTSLAIILPTALSSYRAHRARGLVIPHVLKIWTLPVMAGVAVGAVAAVYAPAGFFELAFVIIAPLIATRFLFGSDSFVLGNVLPGRAVLSGIGFLIGLGSSLIGISGGSLATIALTLYGKPIHNAVATSAGIGVPITLAGTFGYALAGLPHQSELPPLSVGFVSIIGLVLIAPISSYVAPLGARLAHVLPQRRLELGFAAFLLIAAARFLVSLLVQARS